MRLVELAVVALGGLLVLAGIAVADDATPVLVHLRQLIETTRKWSDRTQNLSLRIIDSRGGERSRDLVIRTKKYDGEQTRTVVRFESPPDVKGVGMLQWADPKGADSQWLYLPELRKVRPIAGGAKRQSFVGTDFSYEDLAIISQFQDWTDTEARATLSRQEELNGEKAQVLEFVPTGKDLAYGKILVWLVGADLLAARFEFYDPSGELKKRLSQTDWRPVDGIATAFHMEMENIQGGSKTVAEFSQVQYNSGLTDEMFTQRALE